jgi:hypothetical protein
LKPSGAPRLLKQPRAPLSESSNQSPNWGSFHTQNPFTSHTVDN